MWHLSTIEETEREAIREALARFLCTEADENALRLGMQSERGYDPSLWQQMADMGLLNSASLELHAVSSSLRHKHSFCPLLGFFEVSGRTG